MSSPVVSVLLSTYNGERYLGAQLASLWQQTFQDFELVVRDDGSSDGTRQLVQQAADEHPGRVRILPEDGLRLGPKASFGKLLSHATAPYIAFCDQDDSWLPHKLERLLDAIKEQETGAASGTPVLACSDVQVTDAQLNVTDDSYFAKHRFSVSDGRDLVLPRMLFRNYAIGATTMINRPLAAHCMHMPDSAIMHDWWCALVACAMGRAVVVAEPLMLYRQHGANAVGSRRRAVPRTLAQAGEYLSWCRAASARCIGQAIALQGALGHQLHPAERAVLDRFVSFASQSAWQRARTIATTRAFKPGVLLNGLHVYACMTVTL